MTSLFKDQSYVQCVPPNIRVSALNVPACVLQSRSHVCYSMTSYDMMASHKDRCFVPRWANTFIRTCAVQGPPPWLSAEAMSWCTCQRDVNKNTMSWQPNHGSNACKPNADVAEGARTLTYTSVTSWSRAGPLWEHEPVRAKCQIACDCVSQCRQRDQPCCLIFIYRAGGWGLFIVH